MFFVIDIYDTHGCLRCQGAFADRYEVRTTCSELAQTVGGTGNHSTKNGNRGINAGCWQYEALVGQI